ncbi:MAG: hypothetical protein IH612_16855 [Desulfofustis sp.]|nr:hypothetical protein [Desulfofustis sp.]
MKTNMKYLGLGLCLACCLLWTTAYAAQQSTDRIPAPQPGNSAVQVNKTLSPGTMLAEPLAAICAKLSGKINEDKEQLRSVLGYLHDFGCESEPAASTTQCVELKRKQAALESRIEANQRTARARGCR